MIIAPNHFSFMDHFLAGSFTLRRIRFVGKSQIFKWPMQWIFSTGGVFPVRRGWRDEEMFITARMVLRKGRAIVMYLEGGRSRTGELSNKAYPGLGRIALESGAPVVPTAIYGSAKARNWKRLQFPSVTVEYGQPMFFGRVDNPTREEQQAVSDKVHAEIHRLYAGLERRNGRRKARR
jgi:1-acyl-sn-glycerol-3-phosphate acyltransferase